MQPRTLDQVLSSLSSVYDPQVASVRQRQAEIPNQVAAEEKGLQAKQTSAFDEIVGGARRRGIGFSGIPIGEQAKYNATEYMPALARLRQGAREQALSLEDAILGINERRRTQGQSIYENERNYAEQQRQFNASLAEQRRQAAAAAKAASSFSPSSFLPSDSGVKGASNDPTQVKLAGGKTLQNAYDAVNQLMETRNTPLIARTYQAIYQSAMRGNSYDKAKLQLFQQKYANALKKNGIGQNMGNGMNLGPASPTIVPWNSPKPTGGLSVGYANPGRLQVR